MSRYIDVDKLSPDLYMETNDFPLNPTFGTMMVIRGYSEKIIDSAPSIDICFCRECKKSHIDGKATHYLWCTEWGRSTDVFGYCERGEREGE